MAALLVVAGTDTLQAEQHFESGPSRVPLVELYTSEGCSSCPPADRWLSTLVDDPGLFETFVPVGFHVDYWNYIGWEDRFARRAFSDRQRRYIRQGAARAVYTPGFFVAGEEWLGWRRGNPVSKPRESAGMLAVRVMDDTVRVRFMPRGGEENARLEFNLVLLGMGLETEVRAGENRGRKLRHDFVALNHSVKPVRSNDGIYEADLNLGANGHGGTDLAIAVWVAEPGSEEPIQATGGLL